MPPTSIIAQLVARIPITFNRAFAHFSSSDNALVICCCSSASKRQGWLAFGANVLSNITYTFACTSKSPWVCCPSEAQNMLIMHSMLLSQQLKLILSGPLELLCQLLLAWPLQQGPSLQGCPEQPRPQLPLRLMPRPEAASSYASQDCMQCDILRGGENHMVKPLTCKRHNAVLLPWTLLQRL